MFLLSAGAAAAGAERGAGDGTSDVYFNAATEKYLQGDYIRAVENLEALLEVEQDPARRSRAVKFAEKIVIEGAMNFNLMRNYREALKILEKGKRISPDNPKMLELEKITNDVLTPKQERARPESQPPAVPAPAVSAPAVPKSTVAVSSAAPAVPAPAVSAPAVPESTVAVSSAAPAAAPAKSRKPARTVKAQKEIMRPESGYAQPAATLPASPPPAPAKENRTWITVIFGAVSTLLLALAAYAVACTLRLKKQIGAQSELLEKKMAQVSETIKNELRNAKREPQQQTLRREALVQPPKEQSRTAGQPEPKPYEKKAEKLLIKYGEERLKETILEAPAVTEEVFMGYPELEAARNRIAIEVSNLFEISPPAALNFLAGLKADPDASVRANIPRALASLGTPEAVDMLISMTFDADGHVKREVLKNLKDIVRRAANGLLDLPEGHARKAGDALRKEIEDGSWII
jgi:tetratricopeptide (TPR) repeat protein